MVSILDDSLIEVAESVEDGPLKLQSFYMLPSISPLLRNVRWTLVPQQVWLIGNVALGNNTAFTSQFQVSTFIRFVLSNAIEG